LPELADDDDRHTGDQGDDERVLDEGGALIVTEHGAKRVEHGTSPFVYVVEVWVTDDARRQGGGCSAGRIPLKIPATSLPIAVRTTIATAAISMTKSEYSARVAPCSLSASFRMDLNTRYVRLLRKLVEW